MMELTDFSWEEREGILPGPEDMPFHEWILRHASGRVMALVRGPQDQRGGFSHDVVFLFSQDVTMHGGPFIFVDFDSGKAFAESVVSRRILSIEPDGELTVQQPPNEMTAFQEAMIAGMRMIHPKLVLPE